MGMEEEAETLRINPLFSNSTKAFLATDPLILNLSINTPMVINLYVGTSLYNLSLVASSRRMAFSALSLVFPLDHFFFFALPPEVFVALAGAVFSAAFAYRNGINRVVKDGWMTLGQGGMSKLPFLVV